MNVTSLRVYKVEVDLTLSDGTVLPYQDISEFCLASMNQQEVSFTSEGSFEGLFDFYFTEFKLDLRGDWLYGESFNNQRCVISPYARVRVSRAYSNNSKQREFLCYVQEEGLTRDEFSPGFYASRGLALSYATLFKAAPLGKISTYEDTSAPQETFSLYEKTIKGVPFNQDAGVGEIEDATVDLTIYLEPSVYLQEGSVIPGDRIEFSRVTIFDTKTLDQPISTDLDNPFYFEIPNGYSGDTGVIDGWYSYGLTNMPVKEIASILEAALSCANKYSDLTGRNFPRFSLRASTLPPLVSVNGVSILTVAWHVQVVEWQDLVFAFVWTNQFSVTIYQITNGVQVSPVPDGQYSWFAPSLEWIKSNSRTGHIGEHFTGIGYSTNPRQSQESINSNLSLNPFRYTNYHPDGTMYARVLGCHGDVIYFGWSSLVRTVAAYNSLGNDQLYRAESCVWLHSVGFDINTGRIEHSAPTSFSPSGTTRYFENERISRWSIIGVDYSSSDQYLQEQPGFNEVRCYVPQLSGVNTFHIHQVQNTFFTFDEWIGNTPYNFNPIGVSGFRRSAYSLFYVGPLLADRFSLFMKDKKVSDLILLICKLTNSAPVIEYEGGGVSLSFRQRPLYSYEDRGSNVPDFVLNESSILAYKIKTENYLKDEDINIRIDLENVPDALQKAFQDYYRYTFMPRGISFHLINVPLTGTLTPSWLRDIESGDKVGVRGKVLEYLGPKERELDATLIFMER